MKNKISMKTIYLILVISIGLIGLGIGSTYAVFTASAEISNPISFSSNLSYKADIFDTADITIGPNSSKNVNFAIYNDEQIEGVNYATWYIYDGDSNDLAFSLDTSSSDAIDISGQLYTNGGVIYITIINNTSNTISLTMGVATSKDDIVIPSYMKLLKDEDFITLLSDFDYAIGTYYFDYESVNVTVPDGDILLVKYNGSDTSVNVPATYTVNGVTYNTVVYGYTTSYFLSTFSNSEIVNINFEDGVKFADLDNILDLTYNSMSGLFYNCTSLTKVTGISDTIANMQFTFYGCTSLTTAPTIPSSVTNMHSAFENCTNLTGNVNIESSDVSFATSVFNGTTKEITVYVPANSTTYTNFSALTTSNGMPSNVTLNTIASGS